MLFQSPSSLSRQGDPAIRCAFLREGQPAPLSLPDLVRPCTPHLGNFLQELPQRAAQGSDRCCTTHRSGNANAMSIGGDSPKHSPGRNVPAIGPQRSNPSDDNPSAAPAFEGRGCSQRYREPSVRTTTACRRFPHAEPELSVPEGRNRKFLLYLM